MPDQYRFYTMYYNIHLFTFSEFEKNWTIRILMVINILRLFTISLYELQVYC